MANDSIELPDRPGGTSPHVIVEDVNAPLLNEEDLHHLEKVRRLRSRELVSVTDGVGAWRWCEFQASVLVPCADIQRVVKPEPVLTVGFALVKGSKPELVVQKLTELGIDVICPFVAERSVVRWDDSKIERQTERLTKVSREASMQSRRVWLPDVRPVAMFSDLVRNSGVVRADRGGEALNSRHTTVLVGPEGGWSETEQESTPIVGIGQTVLRSETAAIAVGTLMISLRDGRSL
ncbi:MAG: RsmE family RNA methyltransferase [Actinomycetota bacterium]